MNASQRKKLDRMQDKILEMIDELDEDDEDLGEILDSINELLNEALGGITPGLPRRKQP